VSGNSTDTRKKNPFKCGLVKTLIETGSYYSIIIIIIITKWMVAQRFILATAGAAMLAL
jgi:hypothetical protein